jgi:hypothetical protein
MGWCDYKRSCRVLNASYRELRKLVSRLFKTLKSLLFPIATLLVKLGIEITVFENWDIDGMVSSRAAIIP